MLDFVLGLFMFIDFFRGVAHGPKVRNQDCRVGRMSNEHLWLKRCFHHRGLVLIAMICKRNIGDSQRTNCKGDFVDVAMGKSGLSYIFP
jgi:hypothetical protein